MTSRSSATVKRRRAAITPKQRYAWDDERGIIYAKEDRQAIQLLVGPASYQFRRTCGELLVAALNTKRRLK